MEAILDNVRYLLERQAKLVIVMVSYDEPHMGHPPHFTRSVRFFSDYLRKQLDAATQTTAVYFNEGGLIIDNFEEKIETEFFSDNSVLVLENAYFEPAETGFRIDGGGSLVK